MLPSIDQTYKSAVQQFNSGNLFSAEQLCQEMLKVDPNNADANHLLGIIASQQGGKHDAAVQFIRRAIQSNPNNAGYHNNLGLILDDLGRIEEAITSYRNALALKPDYTEVHINLGVVLQKSNKIDEAIVSYRNALTINPNIAVAHNNLGRALYESGRVEDAITSYRNALAINPNIAEVLNNLGRALYESGRMEDAIISYRNALAINSDFADAHHNLGVAYTESGRTEDAIASYRKALAINPDFADAHNNLGVAFTESGRTEDAIISYRKALAINPDFADAHHNLGVAYTESGRTEDAITSYRKALAISPDYAEAHNVLGCLLQKSGRLEDAVASFRKALSLKPDFADAYSNLGDVFRTFGYMDEALGSYRKALSIDQEFVKSIFGLTIIVKFSEYDDFTHRIEDLYGKNDITDEDKIFLGFALGKIFADLKEYDKSFEFILEANRLMHKSYEYSIQGEQDTIERIKKTFSKKFFSKRSDLGSQDRTPIFILGMPRSGTSLVEQILASHPRVFGAGELTILLELIDDFCPNSDAKEFTERAMDLNDDVFGNMGSRYVDRTREYSSDAKHITDKMPHNFLHIGVIRLILPNAKVIHCTRNPMDNCFSIFKNKFSEAHYYANDLTELGQYYKLYLSLMEHWENVMPGFIYSIKYEELVADQENQTRKLLEYCELPWDKACLDFHRTERSVSTLSAAQVRQPIYKESVELWKRYEKQLEPLHKAIYG